MPSRAVRSPARGKSESNRNTGRLVILCGPSCAGKTPLTKALAKFYPELHSKLRKLVLTNSRRPRPGEVEGGDYYFRTRDEVEALRSNSRYAVLEVRSDIQALDLPELNTLLREGDVLFEGNAYVGRALQTHPSLAGVKRLSVFISPLSRDEIVYLNAPERNIQLKDFLADVMRRKLLRRTSRHKGILSAIDLEDIETRAGSAYRELQEAWHFDYVIPNHDGEDSDNWEAFYHVIGDARKTLEAFAALLSGVAASDVENWNKELLA